MSQKLLKSQIPGRFLPGGDDLDDFLLADQRNKDEVIGVRQFLSDVSRDDRDPLFGGHHHEDTLDVVGPEKDIRVVAGSLVHLVKTQIADGIAGAGRGHKQETFPVKLRAAQRCPPGKRMAAVDRNHERTPLDQTVFDGIILYKLGAVPCKNNIVFILQEPCGEKICVPTVAGDEDIRISIMEETQRAGKIAPLEPFRVSDAECTDHAGRNLLDPVYRLVDPVEDGSGIVQKGASCGSQCDRTACPVEERDAETVLQGMDLLGDRGLRNIKLIGCFREAAALGGSHEISELVCIHNGNFL